MVTVNLETRVRRSFRVEQVAGMLDLPVEERLRHSLRAEVPGIDEEWRIGAIVGPSGSGKTTLARAAFGGAIWEGREWPRGRAIVEVVGDAGETRRQGEAETRSDGKRDEENGRPEARPTIKEIARVLTAVGLGSVPTWLKPYEVLSTGEKFRAELARAIQESGVGSQESVRQPRLLVFDEFTSSLDRIVAKTTSAALARLLRREGNLRFVAVTCHGDILRWLAPDWVVRMGASERGASLTWKSRDAVRIQLKVERVRQAMWERFAPHHYLSGGLAASATCYGGYWEGEAPAEPNGSSRLGGSLALPSGGSLALPSGGSLALPSGGSAAFAERHRGRSLQAPIAFCAVVAALGWKKTKRITRLVTLPEFQGLGIGARLMEEVAARERAGGNRVTITASHPAIVSHCSQSPRWSYLGMKKSGSTRQRMEGREVRSSRGRAVASFEFVGKG